MSNNNPENRREDKVHELITSGSISSAVWHLAWPTIINMVLMTAYNLINRAFLGGLEHSAAAQAAIGIGGIAPMIQFGLLIGLTAGTSALVSRFIGAKEYTDAEEATRQSLIFGVIAGIISMIPLVLLAGPFVRLLGAKPDVAPLAAGYTMIFGAFTIPLYLQMIIGSALQASGDTKSPLYTAIVMVIVNIAFDWLLIFGIGPFPELGVKGAALATGISRTVSSMMMIYFLRRSVLKHSLRHLRMRWEWCLRILKIGWPAAAQQVLFSTGNAVYIGLLGGLPDATAAQAALSVAGAIEATSFMPGASYRVAATPLVGQNLGAGSPKRAERCAWTAVRQAVIIMSVMMLVFLIFPAQLAHIFTKDKQVIALIVSYLRINALCQPFLAVGMVLAGSLQGAGDTRFATLTSFFSHAAVRLPLTWLLARVLGMDATGAWIAMCTSNICSSLLITWWFRRGNWKTLQI